MEMILNNPGFVHLAEIIFCNLDWQKLDICKQINESSRQLLDRLMNDAMFWMRQFKRLSKQNQEDWIKVIQSVKNSDKGIAIISYLKWNLMKEVVDPPCYPKTSLQILNLRFWSYCCANEDIEIAKLEVTSSKGRWISPWHGNS